VKGIIHEEVRKAGFNVSQILLFGSRARGEARADSDWDLYIIIDHDPGFRLRSAIGSRIRWRLACEEDIDADVFVQSESTVEKRKKDTGYLTYYALKEGVPL